MITLTREEAQQVLDALDEAKRLRIALWQNGCDCDREHTCNPMRDQWTKQFHEAGETLRARLSAPEPEPVAWVYPDGLEALKNGKCWTAYGTHQNEMMSPLYTALPQREITDDEFVAEAKRRGFFISAPQQREWVGLTDDEIEKLFMWQEWSEDFAEYEPVARAIEAKLREKNT